MASSKIKAIIGLGNPGQKFSKTRHNIGFIVLDALARKYACSWKNKDNFEYAEIDINATPLLLIKPQAFMNNSGLVVPYLQKKGIAPQETIVIHDDIELPFGKVQLKTGGSHKGHNGLRSLINAWGADFHRIRIGVSRPENKDDVPEYVLQNFTESPDKIEKVINEAIAMLETYCMD